MKKLLMQCAFVSFLLIFHIFSFAIDVYHWKGKMRVIFFDVGQGDSALIQTPNRKYILVDGGPDNTVLYKLGKFLPWWQRSIDLLILSHPERDHLMGFLEVAHRFRIKNIMMTGVHHSTDEYLVWQKYLAQEKIPLIVITSPQVLELDKVTIKIFFPESSLWGKSLPKVNNSSIIFQAVYGDRSFLFTGDMEADAQMHLVLKDIQSDVLKFPHHGSADGLNGKFLRAINPSITVISAGKNTYGHPSPRTLRELKRQAFPFFITRDAGDIILESDGQNIFGPMSW